MRRFLSLFVIGIFIITSIFTLPISADDSLIEEPSSVETEAPADEIPAEDPVVEDNPVEDTPVEDTPVEDTPVEDTPVEDTPVEDTPIEDTPVEDTPVEDTPIEDTPVEDTPVEDTPIEDTPVEDTPVEDTPVEDTPIEDTPVEDNSVEENPVSILSDTETTTSGLEAPVVVSNLPAKENLHIYLCIGQSNMAGRGTIREEDKVRYGDNILLLNGDNEWEIAQPWYDPLYPGETTWAGYNRYSTNRYTVRDSQGTSPAMFFAKYMSESGEIPAGTSIGIISNARGNTNIASWQKDYVDPNPEDGEYSGHGDFDLFEDAVARTKEAMKTGTLKGILWVQGEGACLDTTYITSLNNLVDDLRKALGVGTEVPFIAAEMPRFLNNHAEYNKRLVNFLSVENNTDFIVLPDGLASQSDSVHYETAGLEIVGRRFAEKILNPTTDYVRDTFAEGTDLWTAGYNNNVTGTNYATVTSSNGILKGNLFSHSIVNSATPTITREVNGGSGIRFGNDKIKITTRFKVNNGIASNRVYLKMNRPEIESDLALKDMNYNRYSLFRISDTGFWCANGPVTGTESTTNMTSIYSGSGLFNSWINLEIVLDAANKTADYYVKVENEDGSEKVSFEKIGANLTRGMLTTVTDGVETITSVPEDDLVTLKRFTWCTYAQDTSGTSIDIDYFNVVKEKLVSAELLSDGNSQFVIDTGYSLGNINQNTVKVTTVDGTAVSSNVSQNGKLLTVTTTEISASKNFIITIDGATFENETVPSSTFTASTELIVSEDFDSSVGGWKKGVNLGTATVPDLTVSNGSLKVDLPIPSSNSGNSHYLPNIVREVGGEEGLKFTEGKVIIMKTRIRPTNMTASSRIYFKLNRPQDSTLPASDVSYNSYTMFMLRSDNQNVIQYPSSLNEENSTYATQMNYTKLTIPGIDAESGDTSWANNRWFNIEIHLDGYYNKASYYISTDDGAVGSAVDVPLISAFTDTTMTELRDYHTAFKSVTIHTLIGGTTLEMDYFRVFEAPSLSGAYMEDNKAVYTINTSLPVDQTTLSGITLKDASGNNVTIEKSAVYNTVFVKVPTEMTDSRYTLTMSGVKTTTNDILKDKTFYLWKPEAEIRDDFENGVSKWEIMSSAAGYKPSSFTATDGIATAQSVPAGSAYLTGGSPGIIRMINSGIGVDIGAGEEFVIKTRIKKTGSNARLFFKINHPYESTKETLNANSYNHYSIAMIHTSASNSGIWYAAGTGDSLNVSFTNAFKTEDLTNKWVEIEFHIHGGTDTMDLSLSYEGTDGEMVKYVKSASIAQPKGYHHSEYFTLRTQLPSKPVTTFDKIKTISITSLYEQQDVLIDYLYAYKVDANKTNYLKAEKTGSKVTTDGFYANQNLANQNVETIVALYSENEYGKELESLKIFNDKILPYGYYNENHATDIIVPNDGKKYTIKTFLWEKGTLVPLTDNFTL